MKPSQAAYDMICQFESLRLRAYKALPTEKYYSIGYGHLSTEIRRGQIITKEVAEKLMLEDVEKFSGKLSDYCPKLKQHQYDALCSFIYNVGWYNFRYSMTGEIASHCNISRAPEEVARRIVQWVKAGGQELLGLKRRRVFEANYFLGYSRFFIDDETGIIKEIKKDFTYEL